MSSIDQAFVKAFARRSRPTRDTSHTITETSDPASQDAGELPVDPSVTETTQVWIDPDEDRVLRTDAAAEDAVPEPHALAAAPIRPAEHFRCDYVFGAIEEVLPAEPDGEVDVADTETSLHQDVFDAADDENAIAENELEDAEQSIETNELEIADAKHLRATNELEIADAEHLRATNELEIADAKQLIETNELEIADAEHVVADEATSTLSNDKTLAEVSKDPEANTTSPPKGIQAAWEVDMFEVPSTTADLFFDEKFFQGIASHMRDAVTDGMKSLVVTSAQSGEGRSTVAIGIAIAAAATGLKVALVDGDTEEPTLADDLRLDLEYGWVDTIRGKSPIDQIAVQSIQDGVVLFPLVPSHDNTHGATAAEVHQLMQTLTDQFDLIVVDGPTCAMPRIHQFAGLVDTAIIARDASRTDSDTINDLSSRLQQSGIKGVGVVENFS